MQKYELYIPWDTDLFLTGIDQLLANLGMIMNIALWGFLIITGIYLIVKIANSIIG